MQDSILFWNGVALEANRISHTNGKGEQTGPTLSSRALAIVHLAMYDAYRGTSGTMPPIWGPYINTIKPIKGASSQAAVAAAAHATLSELFPSQKPFFDEMHQQAGLQGSGLKKGHQFGLMVAESILDDRKDDPGAGDEGYAASVARGAHRVDPHNPCQGYHAPFYGARSKGFAITGRHELDSPPFDNNEYRNALKEVYGKGISSELMGTLPNNISSRTPYETLIGIFWGYDGAPGLGTPVRLYNQMVRLIAVAAKNTEEMNARLFALVNVAMGDAGILAWDQKYIHDLWRPVVGIRENDPSMGPASTGATTVPWSSFTDTNWLPLGAPATNSMNENFVPFIPLTYPFNQAVHGKAKNFTPPFPSYPSGHATFGAAAFYITWLFLNKELNMNSLAINDLIKNLEFVSDELNGINEDNQGTIRPRHVRKFNLDGLTEMIEENGRSRVYLGVHWIFDAFAVKQDGSPDLSKNIGGVPLGKKIAKDIYNSGMKKSTVYPRV